MREPRLKWLKAHREEYADQYVALAGDVLVGKGRQFAKPLNKLDTKVLRIPFWYG